jgi:hypothetical protein
MLTVVLFKDAPEQIEILVDSKGVDGLVQYLTFVRDRKDHMHLNVDCEIDPLVMPGIRIGVFHAKHVRIEFNAGNVQLGPTRAGG